jgi:hypothetical protein
MKQRAKLKSQILSAWQSCICDDYCQQRINSERSLQASFWSRLNNKLSHNRRTFIEPRMPVDLGSSQKIYIPDIVICNSRQIIGVIELKYLPRSKPRYEKDVNNLADIAKHKSGIILSNERFWGPAVDSRKYTLAENVLFVWASVHAGSEDTWDEDVRAFAAKRKELQECFLELHAQTDKNRLPTIYWRLLSDKSNSPLRRMPCTESQ